MRCQARKIGESDWEFCGWHLFKSRCNSAIYDTRVVSKKFLEKEAKEKLTKT